MSADHRFELESATRLAENTARKFPATVPRALEVPLNTTGSTTLRFTIAISGARVLGVRLEYCSTRPPDAWREL